MEMIDVLTKLKEIAESKPELVKDAVDNVEKNKSKSSNRRWHERLLARRSRENV